MAASLVMAAALPEACGDRGLLFAGAFVAMQIGRTTFIVWAMRSHPALYRNFRRILAWLVLSGDVWIAGGLAGGSARELLWLVAVAINLTGPVCGFFTAGLGRSSTHDWSINGEHFGERCQHFLAGVAWWDERAHPAGHLARRIVLVERLGSGH